MKLANLKRAIEKRGGEATITQETLTDRYTGRDWPHWELSGTLNGHDVSMTGSNGTDSCGFYTTRAIAKPTDVVEGREPRIWKLPPTADRWKLRSQTYPGIAAAMADQWGGLT